MSCCCTDCGSQSCSLDRHPVRERPLNATKLMRCHDVGGKSWVSIGAARKRRVEDHSRYCYKIGIGAVAGKTTAATPSSSVPNTTALSQSWWMGRNRRDCGGRTVGDSQEETQAWTPPKFVAWN